MFTLLHFPIPFHFNGARLHTKKSLRTSADAAAAAAVSYPPVRPSEEEGRERK